jgi:hypothetical protein
MSLAGNMRSRRSKMSPTEKIVLYLSLCAVMVAIHLDTRDKLEEIERACQRCCAEEQAEIEEEG